MINILAVDDEKEILKIMKKALEKEGYVVTTVSEPETVKKMNLGCFQMILLDVMMPGTDGFSLCREIRDKVDCPILFVTAKTGEKELMTGLCFQMILLDVMMPGTDGFSLCREIRDKVDCPILFVTAKTGEKELMTGLGIGGDDYITKPFGIGELRARVAAHLRRENRQKKNAVFVGEIQLELRSRKIFYKGEEIPLTKSEYAICEYLAMNKGQIFSKERIYEHIFGFDGESDLSVITEHIKNIRAKFQKKGLSVIETKWGIGYRWE